MGLANRLHRKLHTNLVFARRAEELTRALDALLPSSATILDVGCGNGLISWNLHQSRPGRQFTGIDVVERDSCMIPCRMYDGNKLPFAPGSFDYVLFIDVLHHTTDAENLLAQAKTIARRGIVLKDHYCESNVDYYTLALMDWFGNAQHGVALPNNYKGRREWSELFARLGLRENRIVTDIPLYPTPFSLIFERGLHFVSLHDVS